jgi:uncharacterized membrane protein
VNAAMTFGGIAAGWRRRWLLYGLVLSLALNAFFIGAAATDLLRPHHKGGPLRYELKWLQGKLPADGLAKVHAALDAISPKVEQHVARLNELRLALGALAAQPQPDRAAIDQRLAEIRAELNTMVTEGQVAATDALLALPPETRAKLADSGAQ